MKNLKNSLYLAIIIGLSNCDRAASNAAIHEKAAFLYVQSYTIKAADGYQIVDIDINAVDSNYVFQKKYTFEKKDTSIILDRKVIELINKKIPFSMTINLKIKQDTSIVGSATIDIDRIDNTLNDTIPFYFDIL